ncbi:uncharacterized protein EI90DRAFT_3132665 [Cantharellus anzutake]|uniref:uncharacterized protein n=1 Tax=Cantharellus anzutake TaxID=1750568 RepID=UPI0019036B8E|nr:uncharacterized protein EI90DRAFT_3132665 [Cantharellus anzutake]KAF8319242.1 hypothetical protein EI90DRAFT_3132665 [Cantharellus anzutake]
MPSDPKSHHFPPWLKKTRHPSELSVNRLQVSTPPSSNNQIIGPTTAYDRRNDKDQGSPAGLHSGTLTATAPALLLPGDLQDDTTEQRTLSYPYNPDLRSGLPELRTPTSGVLLPFRCRRNNGHTMETHYGNMPDKSQNLIRQVDMRT